MNRSGPTGEASDCRGKIPHQSLESAQRAADTMTKNKKTRSIPYECPWCGKFHIGHARRSANNKNAWR